MFHVRGLGKWVGTNPQQLKEFIRLAAEWTADQYRYHLNVGNIDTAVFFLEVIRHFQNYVPSPIFLDPRSELRAMQTLALNDQEQAIIALELCRTYLNTEEKLTVDTAIELLSASVKSRKYPLTQQGLYVRASLERDSVLYQRNDEIRHLINAPETQKKLVDGIRKELMPNAEIVWHLADLNFPHLTGQSKSPVYMNLVTGTFYGGGELKSLPLKSSSNLSYNV